MPKYFSQYFRFISLSAATLSEASIEVEQSFNCGIFLAENGRGGEVKNVEITASVKFTLLKQVHIEKYNACKEAIDNPAVVAWR